MATSSTWDNGMESEGKGDNDEEKHQRAQHSPPFSPPSPSTSSSSSSSSSSTPDRDNNNKPQQESNNANDDQQFQQHQEDDQPDLDPRNSLAALQQPQKKNPVAASQNSNIDQGMADTRPRSDTAGRTIRDSKMPPTTGADTHVEATAESDTDEEEEDISSSESSEDMDININDNNQEKVPKWFSTKKKEQAQNRRDFEASLEHIMVIGNQLRHADWRRRVWEQTKSNPSIITDQNLKPSKLPRKPSSSAARNNSGDSPPVPPHPITSHILMHAEDIRLYGRKGGCPMEPWPIGSRKGKRTKHNHNGDQDWNQEHGDTIYPIEFADNYLSQVLPPSPVEADNSNNPHARYAYASCTETELLMKTNQDRPQDLDRLNFTVSKEEVPRAMLLRCWQRAVDAATFTTLQPTPIAATTTNQVDGTEGKTNNKSSRIQFEFDTTKNILRSQKSMFQQCQDLEVGPFPNSTPNASPYPCRNCGNTFPDYETVQTHFYGTDQTRGCGWSLLRDRQHQVLRDVLRTEVVGQANALVHLILMKARNRLCDAEKQAGSDPNALPPFPMGSQEERISQLPELFNWQDVLDMLQEELVKQQTGDINDDDGDDEDDFNEDDDSSEEEEDGKAANDANDGKSRDSGKNGTEEKEKENGDSSQKKSGPEKRKSFPPITTTALADAATATLHVDETLAPLVVNEHVLQAAKFRLTERYAAVPS